MATVYIQPAKLAAAYRYANLIRNKAKRDYANAYITWLRNGAVGYAPERGRISLMAGQAVVHEITAMNLWTDLIA